MAALLCYIYCNKSRLTSLGFRSGRSPRHDAVNEPVRARGHQPYRSNGVLPVRFDVTGQHRRGSGLHLPTRLQPLRTRVVDRHLEQALRQRAHVRANVCQVPPKVDRSMGRVSPAFERCPHQVAFIRSALGHRRPGEEARVAIDRKAHAGDPPLVVRGTTHRDRRAVGTNVSPCADSGSRSPARTSP